MKKLLSDMDENEVEKLLDKVTGKIERLVPPDTSYIVILSAVCEECDGSRLIMASDGDKLGVIDMLRQQADSLERDLIESN